MFKIGDEVVCMNPSMNGYHDSQLYYIYKVDFVCPEDYFYGYNINDKSSHRISSLCENKNFILLTDYRKFKLKKICSKLEI